MRRFSYLTKLLLIAVTALTAVSLSPEQALAQNSGNVPIFTCNTGLLNRECRVENPADQGRNLPPSVTTCQFFDEEGEGAGEQEYRRECQTVFEGGGDQRCVQTGLLTAGITDGWSCTGTNPSTGDSYTETGGTLVGSVGEAAGAVAEYAVVKPIVYFILTFASFFLGIVGVFFDWVVVKTVFQFGTYFGTSDGMLTAWGVMRDIANIGLLFGFILMGVLLILNVEGGGHGHGGGISAKKAIPRLIIFAVLLNFSLFATQAVIDVANAFGSTFTALAGEVCDESGSVEECAVNNGISGQVLQMAGIGTVWDIALGTDAVILLGLALFVIITAMVLLAAGIMLVIRVVVLSLLMVTSPIGFAGMVIPGLSGLANRWWHTLISQSFFAPVLLLLIFISLKLAESLNPNGDPLVAAFAGEATSLAGNLQVVVVFAIVIGFMLASIIAASKMGAMGASFATNAASALTFGAVTRGTNFAIGGGARALRMGVQRIPFAKDSRAGKVGQVAVNRFLRPLETTNLDMRRAGLGTVLGAAGVSAGAKAAEHATYGDIAHQFSDIKGGKTGQALQEKYDAEVNTMKLEKAAHDGALTERSTMTPAQKAEAANNRRFLASLSAKELEKLHGIKEGLQEMAENLSPDQFNKLMESKDLTDLEKGKIRAGRFETLNGAAARGDTAAVKDIIKNMNKKDLEQMPGAVLLSPIVLENLSDTQRDDLTKGSARAPGEVAAIKATYANEVLKQVFATTRSGANVVSHAKFSSLSTAQFSELGAEILKQREVAGKIPPTVLTKIQKDNKLKPSEMKEVGAAIQAEIATRPPTDALKKYMSGPNGDFWK